MNQNGFEPKVTEFSYAMQRYNNACIYTLLERINSILVLSFQAITLSSLLKNYDGTHCITLFGALIVAYILTDFVNGLVHMYMDNNTRYTSVVGPFISAFHLHHTRPRYGLRHPFKVYFYETGTKFWLLVYLTGLAFAQHYLRLNYSVNFCLVSIGILSSVAELSHYWCHNATKKNKFICLLQKHRILLSKKHHAAHHLQDNTHYAFLNGITDPLLNKISRYYYKGYKNYADQHAAAYVKLTQTKEPT
jgi:Lipid desaturase domain